MPTPSRIGDERCTARATGRTGVVYERRGDYPVRCTISRFGAGWMTVVSRPGQTLREYHRTRASAVLTVGEWLDPEQGGRFIMDNGSSHLRAEVA